MRSFPADDEPNARGLENHAPCALFVTATDTAVLRANAIFASALGHEPAELIGRPLTELLSPSGCIKFETLALPALTLKGTIDSVALDLRHSDGALVYFLCSAAVSPDDTSVHWVGLNVTGRRSYELDLLASQRRLRRLQDLSAALVSADSIETIASAVLREVVDGIKAHQGQIARRDRSGVFTVVAQASFGDHVEEMEPSGALLERAVESGEPAYATEESEQSSSEPNSALRTNAAAFPLRIGPEIEGMLMLRLARVDPYSEDERQLLDAVAQITAQAVSRAVLIERVRHDAERNLKLSHLLHHLESAISVRGRAQQIAEFLVDEFADYATVELVDQPAPAGAKHCDPLLEDTLVALRTAVNIGPDRPFSLAAGREAHSPQRPPRV